MNKNRPASIPSPEGFALVHRAVAHRSITAVAGVLGVSRTALANVLLGNGRAATRRALAKAAIAKATELEALR
jgi:ABC-type sugar transport system ATPase subunit